MTARKRAADKGSPSVGDGPSLAPARFGQRDRGQILVLAALFFVLLLVLVGSAYDYAALVSEEHRLQNATDAAGLAGANALANHALLPPATAQAIAEATATEYLRLNGFATQTPGTEISFAFPTSTPLPSATPGPIRENVVLDVTRDHRTYFWTLVGIDVIPLRAGAGAHAARGMVDVMLTLDTTGSMTLSGTQDFAALRQAVVDFINQMNPTPSDPRGPKIGIARFAGIKCSWRRGSSGGPAGRDGDRYIDLSPVSEYVTPCTDDKTLLSNLTQDKATLLRIANNSGSAACPPGVAPYGCPLNHVEYHDPPVTQGASTTPLGMQTNNNTFTSDNPTYTGTKLPNAITVLSNLGYYAFATQNGGRNNSFGEGWARKVVVMMTDGFNEAWPDTGNPENPNGYDAQFLTLADSLKRGPDGVLGTEDDVEIYTVGFFCTPYSSSTSSVPQKWCKSRLADTPAPHKCPGPVFPTTNPSPSTIDTLLVNASSSTPGTCDHYFPLKKTESLPQLFQVLAANISRGQLTR